MKKDFQKKAGLLSKVALVLVSFSFAQASFASQTQGLQAEVPAHGRANLTVEDLQTLLGLKTRDPSSQVQMQEQDVVASAPIFKFKMSGEEKARIAKAISSLGMERAQLAKKLEQAKMTQVEALRASRRKIQISRTRSVEGDSSLSQNLFTSLLAEANAEAGVDSALSDFDQNNTVEVQFSANTEGSRSISAIKLGSKVLWSDAASDAMVASR
ncbi:MAG: hypothetical protein ABIR96_01585 [Bdellovibrionota bacterium]